VSELERLVKDAGERLSDDDEAQQQCFNTMEGSCLVPFLTQYINNESLLDSNRTNALF
jgi:hypothetical protein